MSLVTAFIGRHGAVMGGDTREIITSGDRVATETLEHELYCGLIRTDEVLRQRAGELGISLVIRDDKRKVTQRDGILVGEVSETKAGLTRIRRLYATAGEYAIAEITGRYFPVDRNREGHQFRCPGKPGNPGDREFLHPGEREKLHPARCDQNNHALHGAIIEGFCIGERDVRPDTDACKGQSFRDYRTGQQDGALTIPGQKEISIIPALLSVVNGARHNPLRTDELEGFHCSGEDARSPDKTIPVPSRPRDRHWPGRICACKGCMRLSAS